jgi:hypothetical protein
MAGKTFEQLTTLELLQFINEKIMPKLDNRRFVDLLHSLVNTVNFQEQAAEFQRSLQELNQLIRAELSDGDSFWLEVMYGGDSLIMNSIATDIEQTDYTDPYAENTILTSNMSETVFTALGRIDFLMDLKNKLTALT